MAKKSRPLWFGWDVPVAVLLCGPALSVFEGEDWTSGNLTKGPALIFHRLVPAGMTLKTHTLVITFLPLDFVQWKSFGPPFAEGGHGTMFQKGKLEDEASLVFFFLYFAVLLAGCDYFGGSRCRLMAVCVPPTNCCGAHTHKKWENILQSFQTVGERSPVPASRHNRKWLDDLITIRLLTRARDFPALHVSLLHRHLLPGTVQID